MLSPPWNDFVFIYTSLYWRPREINYLDENHLAVTIITKASSSTRGRQIRKCTERHQTVFSGLTEPWEREGRKRVRAREDRGPTTGACELTWTKLTWTHRDWRGCTGTSQVWTSCVMTSSLKLEMEFPSLQTRGFLILCLLRCSFSSGLFCQFQRVSFNFISWCFILVLLSLRSLWDFFFFFFLTRDRKWVYSDLRDDEEERGWNCYQDMLYEGKIYYQKREAANRRKGEVDKPEEGPST